VLVTGATGMQGGAVVKAMRELGIDVAALVRDASSEPALALARGGIELVSGDLDDPESLAAACSGRTTVFSVQLAPTKDADSERRQCANLVGAAQGAGVRQFVHTSVSGTGWRSQFPGIDPSEARNYWDSKEDAESTVREAGFASSTILEPAFFMENFVPPKADWMFPLLADGVLLVASKPTTEVALIAAEDFGAVVAAIVTDPRRFAGLEIELAGDVLTFPEIAATLTDVTGRTISASCRPAHEVDALLGRRSWSATQTWLDDVGYPARPEHAAAHGLEMPTTFRRWCERHRAALTTATTPSAES
jgi:uncharacterized protein YbjT (DUF2867 family)